MYLWSVCCRILCAESSLKLTILNGRDDSYHGHNNHQNEVDADESLVCITSTHLFNHIFSLHRRKITIMKGTSKDHINTTSQVYNYMASSRKCCGHVRKQDCSALLQNDPMKLYFQNKLSSLICPLYNYIKVTHGTTCLLDKYLQPINWTNTCNLFSGQISARSAQEPQSSSEYAIELIHVRYAQFFLGLAYIRSRSDQ